MDNISYTPNGFTLNKEDDNYWLNAVRDFWAETGLDTDSVELMWIVNWFDKRRNISREINQYYPIC